jgi:uncharacterized membrane protein
VARGSTLINVVQQVASSIGVAIMTVLLTNGFKDSAAVSAGQAIADAERQGTQPPAGAVELAQRLGDGFQATVLKDMADAFQHTYVVALVLIVLALVPVAFLPRKREASHLLDDEGRPPVVVH